jgi:hypothetical protein
VSEKRIFTRADYTHFAKIIHNEKSLKSLPIKDISLKGCFLVSHSQLGLKVGDNVEIYINLENVNQDMVHISRKVLRIKEANLKANPYVPSAWLRLL